MTSLLDCQIFSWKVFLVKYLCWNFFLQIDSKWSEMWKKWLSVWPTGWTAQRTKFDWQPFFRLFITPNDPKCEKKPVAGFANQLAGQTVHQTEFLPVTVFLCFGLFEVDLETKFSTKILTKKNLWTVIWQSMTSSCAVNFEIFLVKNFPKKWH